MENKKMKIVSDSSGDLYTLGDFPFSTAALKISAGDRQWVDDENLNIEEMVEFLLQYKGKSGSACPSPNDWVEKFEDYENVFCVTISSNLSGSYNSAVLARDLGLAEFPETKIHVFDSLSAGPELTLIVEKIARLAASGLAFPVRPQHERFFPLGPFPAECGFYGIRPSGGLLCRVLFLPGDGRR